MKIYLKFAIVFIFLLHGVSLTSQILYVDSCKTTSGNGMSWANAYKTLSEALDSAQKDQYITEILVAKGTYTPTKIIYNMNWTKIGVELASGVGTQNKTFHIRAGLKVYGGYPAGGGTRNYKTNKTILSGALASGDTVYHTVFTDRPSIWTSTDTTVIDGFTITNGKCASNNSVYLTGLSVNPQIYSYKGGGIYINNGLCTIRNCIITKNKGQDGVGIFARNVIAIFDNLDINQNLSNMTIYGITLFGFNRGTGIFIDNSNYTFKNSFISNNNATLALSAGNGISSYNCQVNIINNTINNNFTAGESQVDLNLCSGNFANNIFIGNIGHSVSAGLRLVGFPSLNIYNNYFAQNKYQGTSQSGSACIYADGGTQNVYNNIFANNYSIWYGAAFSSYQGTQNIVNNTFIGNVSDSFFLGGAAVYTYASNVKIYNNIGNYILVYTNIAYC